MAARRWIRLDVGWEDSEWLDALDGTAAGCWPRLLCLVKRDGIRGRVKRPAPAVVARRWRVPVEAVLALEAAATAGPDPAMTLEDGEWVVSKWLDYQEPDPTARERKRRERDRRSQDVTQSHRDTVTHRESHRDLSRATPTPTGTETETDTTTERGAKAPAPSRKRATALPEDWAPNDAHRQLAAGMLGVRLSVEVQKFRDHFAANGKPMKDWDAAFRNWLRRAAEFSAGRPAPTGSEAAAVREELPRSTAPRQGDALEERRQREADQAQRVAAWAAAHPDENRTIMAQVKAFLDGPDWRNAPEKLREAAATSEYTRRVMARLRPAAVA